MRLSNSNPFFPSLANGVLFLLVALAVQSTAAPLQLPPSALARSLQIRSRPDAATALLSARAPAQDPTAEERQRRVAAWVAQQQQIASNGVAGLIVQQQKIEAKKAEEGKEEKRQPKRSDSVSSNSSEKTVKG